MARGRPKGSLTKPKLQVYEPYSEEDFNFSEPKTDPIDSEATTKPHTPFYDEEDIFVKERIVTNEWSDKYPSPKKNAIFRAKWNMFIPDVAGRENFKEGHLYPLSILCDLYVEYQYLLGYLNENGFSMIVITANGELIRQRPEVVQMEKTRRHIKEYTILCGLVLVKDKKLKEDEDADDWK